LTNRGKAGYSKVDECDINKLWRECHFVSEGKMFVKDEVKILSGVGGVK